MKKGFKRVLAMMLTLILVVGGLAMIPNTGAKADDGATAWLKVWGWSNEAEARVGADVAATTTVNGDGTYTLTYNVPENSTICYLSCVNVYIKNGYETYKDYTLMNVSIKADDVTVPVDMDEVKLNSDVWSQDADGNWNQHDYAIITHQDWDDKDWQTGEVTFEKVEDAIDPNVTCAETLEVTFTIDEDGIANGEEPTGEDAYIAFADEEWKYDNWSADDASTKVNGEGNYTIKYDISNKVTTERPKAIGAAVFCVDIVGGAEKYKDYAVKDVTVKVDGTALEVDQSKIVSGHLEADKSDFRIEIYNLYGGTKNASPIDVSKLEFAETLEVSFTLDAPETAYIAFADEEWKYDNWSADVASTEVQGLGTYTLKYDISNKVTAERPKAIGAAVFCVDIVGGAEKYKDYAVKDVTVKVDGTALEVDQSKIVSGHLEADKSDFRIEIYNLYGGTKNASPIDVSKLEFAETLEVSFTIAEPEIEDDDNTGDNDNTENNGNTEDTEDTENTEDSKVEFKPEVNVPDSIMVETAVVNEVTSKNYTAVIGYASTGWHFQNWEASTTVSGDGTYTIQVDAEYAASGADVFVIDIKDAWAEMSGYKLMNLVVKCDGNPIDIDMSKVVYKDIEEKGNYRIEIFNLYGPTKDASPVDITDIAFEKSLTISFTLDADGKANVAGTQTATPAEGYQFDTTKMTALVNSNKNAPISIKNDSNVFFVFDAGKMALVDGVTNYDFGSEFDTDYSALEKAPFTKEQFIVRINYNYDGSLPATAKVMIPVGKDLTGKTLYYYEVKADGTYKYTSQGVVDASGYLTVTQSHCSDYVITTYADGAQVDQKGDNVALYAMLLLAGVALVGAGIYSKKKLFA